MFWLWLLLLFWIITVASTYMIFYYEAANGLHLEILRSRGKAALPIIKGFFWSLYSHLLMLVAATTALHRNFWQLASDGAGRTPVIFIHGLYHNHTAWYFYMRWFRKWGWQRRHAVNLRGKFRSIKEYEGMLAEEVEKVLAATGSDKVDLVGHSMGGLVIRSYLTNDGSKAKVRRVVTIGTPHGGSKLAVFGPGTAAKEMVPGSPFLESLNRADTQVPEEGRLYAIYTIADNMVLPNESARLTGDRVSCLETRVVNHLGLVFCKHTAGLVRDCLEET